MAGKPDLFWVSPVRYFSGQRIHPHAHSWYSLIYIREGASVWMLDDDALTVKSGDCFCIPSGVTHSMFPTGNAEVVLYDFKFRLDDPFLCKNLQNPCVTLEISGLAESMMTYLIRNWKSEDEENRQTISHILTAVLSMFFLDRLHYDFQDSKLILSDGFHSATRKVLRYIESNSRFRFTLEELAKELNYNKNYLCTVFSQDTAVSIVDYTNFIRIRTAISYFVYDAFDVDAVGERVGFHSTGYFSRVFKAMTGISPYRFNQAFSALPDSTRSSLLSEETLLDCNPCTMEEAFAAMRHIGTTASSLYTPQQDN